MSRLTDFSAGQSEIIESTANKLNVGVVKLSH